MLLLILTIQLEVSNMKTKSKCNYLHCLIKLDSLFILCHSSKSCPGDKQKESSEAFPSYQQGSSSQISLTSRLGGNLHISFSLVPLHLFK